MQLDELFDRLGLSKHSAAIYTKLERGGPASVAALAKAVHIHRPAVYRALDALVEKLLISKKTFGKRSFYAAESRERIADAFTYSKKQIHELAQSPEKSLRNSVGAIRYLEGEKSVAAVFADVVEHTKRGETFYRYTSEKDLDEVNRLLPHDYRKRRDGKRLERLVISNPESGVRKKKRLERFIKYLGGNKEAFRQNAIQLIYGTRIAFIDLNTFKAFIIEDETLAEFQKSIFRALYRRL